MPICENCGQKWPWKTVVKNTVKLTNKAKCPYCEKNQYLIPKSRRLTGIFSYIPAFLIITLTLFLDLNGIGIFLLAIALMIVFLGLYPFMMKLSNDEQLPTYKLE
ncbi:hypothetical protein B481_0223 [Planococcus halocryophilus Or1]|uniref:Cxxc_20_cxxc protein n=1 Tax=Planococcus halocryophilus TaxID=1215089 RepID=A0A1C7DST2_9BACL|nr:TIGR04104 family putative zinc finger protein [Planococcus halocryophilus]ANU14464.1 hypothetical protein BBI08_11540 [Planococcus halocryophilus]EMF48105.1 hypothetical protein B481_0223 [Planococcus halocryophilus Or1]